MTLTAAGKSLSTAGGSGKHKAEWRTKHGRWILKLTGGRGLQPILVVN